MKYKFVSWDKSARLEEVAKALETHKGWEVVSHSHSTYGLSVLLRKQILSELTKKPTVKKTREWPDLPTKPKTKTHTPSNCPHRNKEGTFGCTECMPNKPKTGKGDVTRCNTDITKPKDRLKELKKEYDKLLPCIEAGCDNDGTIPEQDREGDWQPAQCEYCYKIRFPLFEWITTNFQPRHQLLEELRGEGK